MPTIPTRFAKRFSGWSTAIRHFVHDLWIGRDGSDDAVTIDDYFKTGETDAQAIVAARLSTRADDHITFWPLDKTWLDPDKRIVSTELILGAAPRSQPGDGT